MNTAPEPRTRRALPADAVADAIDQWSLDEFDDGDDDDVESLWSLRTADATHD